MPRNKTPEYLPPKCVHCDKVAADPHSVSEPKPDTDPALIHRVYDPRTFPVSIYHYCGHYTVYAWRRDGDTAPPCEDRRFLFMGERGWGAGGKSIMRVQMHATDLDFLEKRLGERASNGFIRNSATLNRFIDRYGLIDADDEHVAQHGRLRWMLRGDRTPVATLGRYLVVVDTQRAALPAWARRP